MVGQSGETSNCETTSLASQRTHLKDLLRATDSDYSEDAEELFNTLAEWNDFLESHVPYFQTPEEPGL
ncbi:MAG: hypothetical protein AB8B57_03145 [Congregibacter sp.]